MSELKLNTPPGFPTSGTIKRLVENSDLRDAICDGSTATNDIVNSCISLVSFVGNICTVMVANALPE